MLTLACSSQDCLVRVRITRVVDQPVTRIGGFEYCPLCGSKALGLINHDDDYWDALAKAHSMPVNVIQMIYEIWQPTEYRKFSDFVNIMRKESKEVEVA